MKYAISNIHGNYEKWQHILKEIDFTEDDDMYVLGDAVDYGDEPMALLFDMMERPNVYPLMGEHEYNFLKYIKDIPVDCSVEDFPKHLSKDKVRGFMDWIKNGGRTTFESYMKLSTDDKSAILEYLSEFMLYDIAETEDDEFILTNSGIDNFHPEKELEDYDVKDFLSAPLDPSTRYYNDKYMVVGHKPTFNFGKKYIGRIYMNGMLIDIDCGCYYQHAGGKLGCLRLDDFEEFYV